MTTHQDTRAATPTSHTEQRRRTPVRNLLAAAACTTVAMTLMACTAASGTAGERAQPAGHHRAAAAPTAPLPPAATSPASSDATPAAGQHVRPNFVFISTDDQRLDDMRWMPYTRQLIGGHGVTFTHALSPHPLCCPARAEFVTGQYGQNNGVHHNAGVHGGYKALIEPGNTLAAWLHDAGYQTGMVGKYLNQYKPDAPSIASWDRWNPSLEGVYSYNDTTFYNDGDLVRHTTNVDDVVTAYATSYIREFAANDAPFYVWASDLAPHLRKGSESNFPLPAKRYRGTMADATNTAAGKPSYGIPIVNGPRFIADGSSAKVSRRQLRAGGELARLNEARIEALQSVDDGVRRIVETLRQTGELANTYIVFTTDNGYLLGEHKLEKKNFILEEALRVPMLVRVPGAASATSSAVPVTSVDIAPTVADIAGVTPGRLQDGASFARLLHGQDEAWRDTQLVQTGTQSHSESDPGWFERGVRTKRWTYGENLVTGSIELYDRDRDPYQQVNLADLPGYGPVLDELRRRAEQLETCAGAGCHQQFGPDPQPTQYARTHFPALRR